MLTEVMFMPKRRGMKSQYQRESAISANRFKEPIEDWEIELFLSKTLDQIKDDEILFDLAKELSRTFNAMLWWYELMYNSPKYEDNTKAGSLIERFSKFRG